MAKTILTGTLAGSTDAVRMPSVHYQNGYIKAHPANSGNVYIGSSSDVVLGGTTDTAGGWPLDAGEVYPLGAAGNLNELWYITDGATDYVSYIIELF